MDPIVSAVICTYSRYDLLPAAVESLQKQTADSPPFEILVIDNSPDHAYSARFAKKFAKLANLNWIVEKKSGLSNARNVGLAAARGRYIAYMDDDAVASQAWVKTIAEAFEGFGPQAFVIGGKVNPIWGAPQPAWLDKKLQSYVSAVDWGGSTRELGETEWIVGTNIAFRADRLREVGGFSVGLGRNGGGQALLSNEEVEVTEKLKALGGKVLYVPDMQLDHLVESERLTQAWFRRRMIWQATSDYLKDARQCFENAGRHWKWVTGYFAKVPPIERTPAGFFTEKPDADSFREQLSALYNFQICMLSGFNGAGSGERG